MWAAITGVAIGILGIVAYKIWRRPKKTKMVSHPRFYLKRKEGGLSSLQQERLKTIMLAQNYREPDSGIGGVPKEPRKEPERIPEPQSERLYRPAK